MNVCSTPGCPILSTTSGRCSKCRGTTTQRGYGRRHQITRASVQERMDRGEQVWCWRCSALLNGQRWALDHDDERTGYRGPACTSCNAELARLARS